MLKDVEERRRVPSESGEAGHASHKRTESEGVLGSVDKAVLSFYRLLQSTATHPHSRSPSIVLEFDAMDAFMQRVSCLATHDDVARTIARILHQPPFSSMSTLPLNFNVFLFTDKNTGKNKGYGILTFPTVEVGELFLKRYGGYFNIIFAGSPPPECKVGGAFLQFRRGDRPPRQDVVERIRNFPYVEPQGGQEDANNAASASFTGTADEYSRYIDREIARAAENRRAHAQIANSSLS
ncbi:hypothetical protein OF83DRAFT_238804 [Amylostereum chailletii]|nr:hypothetical protein OF83DRAFT_238804 [Amylostereum chailletii]